MTVRSERVTLPGRRGQRLAARWDRPAEQAWAQALVAHCFSCHKDYKAINWLSRRLAESGVGVLRLDFTGLGDSGGDFAETNFSTSIEDLWSAVDFLRGKGVPPDVLVGHSLGGAAALVAGAQIVEARLLVTIGMPSDTQSLRNTLLAARPELASQGEAEVPILGRPFRLKRQLLDDLAVYSLEESARSWHRPWLMFHALEDDVVGFEHAERLWRAAHAPQALISLPAADHLLASDRRDARFVADLTVLWLNRYSESKEH